MAPLSTLWRYICGKVEYSVYRNLWSYKRGQMSDSEFVEAVWKNILQGKLSYVYWSKGQEMAPTIGTVLVRKLPLISPRHVFVGDTVLVKDPNNSSNYIVRRLAAIQGYEMVSTDEKDEPFVLESNQCWILADNEKLKPKEAYDSRTIGPVPMSNIAGRVIYCLRTAEDHGPVQNSDSSVPDDSPVLEMELDVNELIQNHKA